MVDFLFRSLKILYSVETFAMLHSTNDHSNVLLGRRILLVILFTMRYSICVEFEFHMVGEQRRTHVGHTPIRQVSDSMILLIFSDFRQIAAI